MKLELLEGPATGSKFSRLYANVQFAPKDNTGDGAAEAAAGVETEEAKHIGNEDKKNDGAWAACSPMFGL